MTMTHEGRVPLVTAIFVFMILPTTILFLAALITSLLISHFDSLLDEDCNSRIRAFLFGCLALFYTWSLYHFYVLFGWAWKNLRAKLVIFGLFVLVMILWIVNGHLTLKIQISEACVSRARSILHTRTMIRVRLLISRAHCVVVVVVWRIGCASSVRRIIA
jgi:hypothetical protein